LEILITFCIKKRINRIIAKNNIKIKIENKLKINNYESAKGLIKYPISGRELKRTFFIMPDNWVVYTFSTSSPELYEDLEKIVRSFEYTGN